MHPLDARSLWSLAPLSSACASGGERAIDVTGRRRGEREEESEREKKSPSSLLALLSLSFIFSRASPLGAPLLFSRSAKDPPHHLAPGSSFSSPPSSRNSSLGWPLRIAPGGESGGSRPRRCGRFLFERMRERSSSCELAFRRERRDLNDPLLLLFLFPPLPSHLSQNRRRPSRCSSRPSSRRSRRPRPSGLGRWRWTTTTITEEQ